jgi:hypothetical protein
MFYKTATAESFTLGQKVKHRLQKKKMCCLRFNTPATDQMVQAGRVGVTRAPKGL